MEKSCPHLFLSRLIENHGGTPVGCRTITDALYLFGRTIAKILKTIKNLPPIPLHPHKKKKTIRFKNEFYLHATLSYIIYFAIERFSHY